MPIIKEASAKERTLMGNRSHGSAGAAPLKRKREADAGEEPTSNDYFFAKFLTSPELLDLEVRLLLDSCRMLLSTSSN